MRIPLRKWITWYLVAAMFVIGITPRVYAGFSPSEFTILAPAERAAEVEKIQKFLEMKVVRERLQELGFAPDEIQSRLNQLSDPQIHQLALQVDNLKVGGDGLEVVIALLVIAILIVVLIWLLGHKVVIK
ncbi:MAG: PA2779 family protein [Thermodesulfobacteriota bacterium]|jgi:hypothetical protein